MTSEIFDIQSARNAIGDVSKKIRYKSGVLTQILGGTSESDSLLRRVEEEEDLGLFLEGYGVQPVESTALRTPTDVNLSNLTFNCAGQQWNALVEIASRMAMMGETTVGQYNAMSESMGLTPQQKLLFAPGTMHLSNVLRTKREAEIRYMENHSREFEYNTRTYTLAEPQLVKKMKQLERQLVVIPSRTRYEHAGNRLHEAPVYQELPDLTDEWKEFIRMMRTCKRPIIRKEANVGKAPPVPLDYKTVKINHPEYGTYGTYKFALKEEFKGYCEPVIEEVSHTYSIALTSHVPAFMPRWNRRSAYTNLQGGAGRLGRLPVAPELMDYDQMDPYLDRAREHLIAQLEAAGLRRDESAPSPDKAWKWLAAAHFPAAKKFKYAQAFIAVEKDEHEFLSAHQFSNVHKAFPKNELYAGLDKPQRQILAGDLQMAAVLAPMCDKLGNYFFSLPITSKKIPERERPKYAIERFGRSQVILNDMSAFEGSITPHIKNKCEHAIFRHFFPQYQPWIERCDEDLDLTVCGAHFQVPNCRCSGDPQTSLGNSITNYCGIIAAYLYAIDQCHIYHYVGEDGDLKDFELNRETEPKIWVEGDDSLVEYSNFFQHEGFFDAYREAFIKMGFSTKMEIKNFVGNAGYCSMYFTDRAKNSPSLAQTILDFPWCHAGNERRGRELLALKALSLAHSAPGMPIAWAIAAHYAADCNMTAVLNYNDYEREELQREGITVEVHNSKMHVHMNDMMCAVTEPDAEDRAFFTQRYMISADEQIDLEREILKNGIQGIMKRGDMYIRIICAQEGLDYDAYHKFYVDNTGPVDPSNDRMSYHRLRIEVNEEGKCVETYVKVPSISIVKKYPQGPIIEMGSTTRKTRTAVRRRLILKRAFKKSKAVRVEVLRRIIGRIKKAAVVLAACVLGLVLVLSLMVFSLKKWLSVDVEVFEERFRDNVVPHAMEALHQLIH